MDISSTNHSGHGLALNLPPECDNIEGHSESEEQRSRRRLSATMRQAAAAVAAFVMEATSRN